MATVQSYTKAGVDAKFNSRSNMTMVHNGGGSPDLSAYPDSKTGDVIERASDGARWAVVASTINPIAGRVLSVAGKAGHVTLVPGDVGAAPTSHTHTKAQITDLNASMAATANSMAQRTTGGALFVGTPTATTHATTKTYVDDAVTAGKAWSAITGKPSSFTPSSHTHTKAQITDLNATSAATASSIAQRDSSGRLRVETPKALSDAATKEYVDSRITGGITWSNLSGKPSTFAPSTHSHSPDQVNGLQSKLTTYDASVARVNSPVSSISGSSTDSGKLLSLTSTGRLTAVNPSNTTDVANKQYVDSEISAKTTWANTSGKPTTFPPSSHTHTKAQITDLNESSAPTANSIARRDSSGRLRVGTPNTSSDATTKAYVDNAITDSNTWSSIAYKPSTFPPSAHNHDISHITGLNISQSSAGLSVVQRDSAGRIRASAPTGVSDVTTKAYVDGKFDSTVLSTQNLNDLTIPGVYYQNGSPNATIARNYPVASRQGHLVVLRHNNYVKQEYTDYQGVAMYYRVKDGSVWTPWKSITQTEV